MRAAGQQKSLDWRLRPPKLERWQAVPTGCKSFDGLVGGGLPVGLTTLYGNPGSGKTTLALHLAMHDRGRVLYVATERIEARLYQLWVDGKIEAANYAKYRPKHDRFLKEIVELCKQYGKEIVIVDSLTAVFNWEAEIRGPISDFAREVSAEGIAVIGISQARGVGHIAGGLGVLHASTLVLRFSRILIDAKWLSQRYGRPEGSYVWTVDVEKDANGVAMQGVQYLYSWDPEPLTGEPVFRRVAEV